MVRDIDAGARAIANDLALGFSTSQVARKYRLSSLCISQMRRELCDSWECFQGAGFLSPAHRVRSLARRFERERSRSDDLSADGATAGEPPPLAESVHLASNSPIPSSPRTLPDGFDQRRQFAVEGWTG